MLHIEINTAKAIVKEVLAYVVSVADRYDNDDVIPAFTNALWSNVHRHVAKRAAQNVARDAGKKKYSVAGRHFNVGLGDISLQGKHARRMERNCGPLVDAVAEEVMMTELEAEAAKDPTGNTPGGLDRMRSLVRSLIHTISLEHRVLWGNPSVMALLTRVPWFQEDLWESHRLVLGKLPASPGPPDGSPTPQPVPATSLKQSC